MLESVDRPQEIGKDEELYNVDESQAKVADTRGNRTFGKAEAAIAGEGGLLPWMTKEYSGWDVYNNEAKKVDTELVKDWTSNLNSLLLFAAIFAAVLTAFIIESKKMLEEDPSGVMKDILILLTNNLSNGTHTSYHPVAFEAPPFAVTVNSLFFASLSASLVAALASVVALQWVADYDAAITRGGSSPEDRAKRRQFRHAGVVSWRMGGAIAFIPLLLYIAVILFFVGLILWMWTLHHTVGAVVAVGAATAVLFYGGTTLLSVAFVSAPFRTPLSRWIYSLFHLPYSIGYWLGPRINLSSSTIHWLEERHQRGSRADKREDLQVTSRSELGISSMIWLANQLSASEDSLNRLLLLATELPKLEPLIATFPGFIEAPWFSIFDLLGRNLVKSAQNIRISQEEARTFASLARCIQVSDIFRIIHPASSVNHVTDKASATYWSQFSNLADGQWSPNPRPTMANSLDLYFWDIPLHSDDTPDNLKLTIWLSRWRNSTGTVPGFWNEMLDNGIATRTCFDWAAGLLGQFLIGNHVYLWEGRETSSVYTAILDRIVWILIKGEIVISPKSLLLLRRGFESLLIEGSTGIDTASCLSDPYRYKTALTMSPADLDAVHHAFTLLLAKQLNSCTGDERPHRFKEVLVMLWAKPVGYFRRRKIEQRHGIEDFFDANQTQIMRWIEYAHDIPHIHEVFHELAAVQAKHSEIGPLWRVATPQECGDPHLIKFLRSFSHLARKGVTSEQHCTLIHLLCQDLELGPPEAFAGYFTHRRVQKLDRIGDMDPCIRLLVKSVGGSDIEPLYLPFVEVPESQKGSYSRIAAYFMKQHGANATPFILEMQVRLWPVFSDRKEYYRRGLKEPEILTHLRHIFEYPVPCSEHHNHAGHLLLHILARELIADTYFPIDMAAFTAIPMKDRALNVLLTLLIVPEDQEQLVSNLLPQYTHEQSNLQVLQMIRVVKASQYTLLETLRNLLGDLIDIGVSMYPEEVAATVICINKSLELLCEQSMSLLRPLVELVLQVKNMMLEGGNRTPEERKAAAVEADGAIDRLSKYLASMPICGLQNRRVLLCARSKNGSIPAVGWMNPYID